jgi:DNA primase
VARIKDTSVEEVKAAADLVAVVGGRTQLRKQGARHVGRCPFHEERTPSFSVNGERGFYHCFGCGAGGDAITFVRETEGLDFAGAIEWLADRFNVVLEYEELSPQVEAERRRRERLLTVLDHAASFYERHLWESQAGAPVREYLAGRGLGEAVCRELRLGLAPGGATLARKAAAAGFTAEELAAAGLVNRRGNDYFSGRLVFPLADARGRVLGFQARRLREDDPVRAKYVNSPEGDLFRKGAILYGLHLARAAIAKEGRAVVVEGNADVLALRQAGVAPVVASMGTALTDGHLRELSRLTRKLYLCFDGDAAGEAATLRGMEMALQRGFEVRVVVLPPGLDPADTADRFEELLAGAASYLFHRVRLEVARTPDRHEAFVQVRELLDRFDDSPERRDAMRYAADRLDLGTDVEAGLAARARAKTGSVSHKMLDRSVRLERDALAGCLAHPSLLGVLRELGPEHFEDELHRRVCRYLLDGGEADAEVVALLAELDARADAEGIDEETTEQTLLRLRERQLRRELEAAGPERLADLQQALAKVRTAFRELA